MGPLLAHQPIVDRLLALSREGRLRHGYLFFGQPRVGKRTAAVALARALHGLDPDGNATLQDAAVFGAADPSTSPGANAGIDDARAVKRFLLLEPAASPRRTAIIDNAASLTTEAQNALLKVAEEPPPRGLLILVAEDPERLIPALRSRLEPVRFGPVPAPEIAAWLGARGVASKEAKDLSARAGGSPGLAWAIARDESFRDYLENAAKFLRAAPAARKTMAKGLVADDEDFDLDRFIEALLVAAYPQEPRDPKLWHAALQLRRMADSYNLNRRLQLTALADAIGEQ